MSFLFIAVFFFTFQACKKESLEITNDVNNFRDVSIADQKAKTTFFTVPTNTPNALNKLIKAIQKEDSSKNFITEPWLRKNGSPNWKYTVHNINDNSASNFDENDNDFHLYFTPLQDTISKRIKSYLVSYEKENNHYYRLYHLDSLKWFIPDVDSNKQEIIKTLMPFAYFEKKMNGNDNIVIGGNYKEALKIENFSIQKNNSAIQTRTLICVDVVIATQKVAFTEYDYDRISVCYDSGGGNGFDSNGTGGESGGGGNSSVATWNGGSIAGISGQQGDIMTDPVLVADLQKANFTIMQIGDMTTAEAHQLVNFLKGQRYSIDAIEVVHHHYSLLRNNESYFQMNQNFGFSTQIIDKFLQYYKIGFSSNEFASIFVEQALFTNMDRLYSKYQDKFVHKITKIRTSSVSIPQFINNLQGYTNMISSFENEIFNLAQENSQTISGSGDMDILMKIFNKILSKKIGKVIPFVGTGLGVQSAWSAYRLGNYGEAAFELAGVAMDFLPAGTLLETGWTIAGVSYDAFKAYKPISKLISLVSDTKVLNAVMDVLDERNLWNNLDWVDDNTGAKIIGGGQDFFERLVQKLNSSFTITASGVLVCQLTPNQLHIVYYPKSSFGYQTIDVQVLSPVRKSFKFRVD